MLYDELGNRRTCLGSSQFIIQARLFHFQEHRCGCLTCCGGVGSGGLVGFFSRAASWLQVSQYLLEGKEDRKNGASPFWVPGRSSVCVQTHLPLALVSWLCLSFLSFLTTFFGHRINANFELWKQEAYTRGFNF